MVPTAGGGLVPQIVLAVPPEVIRLLTGILSSLQHIEADVRDCRLRLGWPLANRPAIQPGPPPPAAPVKGAENGQAQEKGRPAPRSIHTPAGRKASDRIHALRQGLGLSFDEVGERLGISGAMVRFIETGKSGISARVHEAMTRLDGRP